MLSVGTQAPDFSLYATPDRKITLTEYRAKRVILAFYPADWSPVCGDQMTLYNEMLSVFHEYNAELIGISVDSRWCHMAFTENRKLQFPLLADFEPKGQVAETYDVYDDSEGESQRALYVVDENRVIRWSFLSPKGSNPGADCILEALEEMDKSKSLLFRL